MDGIPLQDADPTDGDGQDVIDHPSLSGKLPVTGAVSPTEKDLELEKGVTSERMFMLEKELVSSTPDVLASEIPVASAAHSCAIEPLV